VAEKENLALGIDASGAKTGAKSFARSADSIKKNARGVSKEVKRTSSSFSSMGLLLKKGLGLVGIGYLMVRATKTSIDFRRAISDLSAITGATGKDLRFFAEQAEAIGKSTTLSASQAATAFKLIASAKPDLLENAEALAEVTKQAVILAEAAGITLPEAAIALGNSMNQFGVEADQASRFINVLAAGAKFGSAEIESVARALKFSGTVAAAAGIGFEELNATIQNLAAIGLKGSQAGSALRNVILKLQVGADDTNPAIVGLGKAMENLGKKNLTVAQMTKLFGLESVVAAQQMIRGAAAVEILTRKLTGTQTATEQARVKFDNLGGDLKKLSSVVEGLFIKTMGSADGVMRKVVQAVTQGIDTITNEFGKIQPQVTAALEAVLEFGKGMFGTLKTVVGAVSDVSIPAIKRVFSAASDGWNALPKIIQEVGIVGAIVGGVKLKLALVGLTVAIGLISRVVKTTQAGLKEMASPTKQLEDQLKKLGESADFVTKNIEKMKKKHPGLAAEQKKLVGILAKTRDVQAELSKVTKGRITQDIKYKKTINDLAGQYGHVWTVMKKVTVATKITAEVSEKFWKGNKRFIEEWSKEIEKAEGQWEDYSRASVISQKRIAREREIEEKAMVKSWEKYIEVAVDAGKVVKKTAREILADQRASIAGQEASFDTLWRAIELGTRESYFNMRSFGTLAADSTVQTFGFMTTFIQEGFFNFLTGNFKGIGDAFVNMGKSILQTWTNLIAQMVARWAASKIAEYFDMTLPGGGGSGSGGGSGDVGKTVLKTVADTAIKQGLKAGYNWLTGGAAGTAAAGAEFTGSVGMAAPAVQITPGLSTGGGIGGGAQYAAGGTAAGTAAGMAAAGSSFGAAAPGVAAMAAPGYAAGASFTGTAVAGAGYAIPAVGIILAASAILRAHSPEVETDEAGYRYGKVGSDIMSLWERKVYGPAGYQGSGQDIGTSFDTEVGEAMAFRSDLRGLEGGTARRDNMLHVFNARMDEALGTKAPDITAADLPDPILFAAQGYSGVTTRPTTFVTSEYGQSERVNIEPMGRGGSSSQSEMLREIGSAIIRGDAESIDLLEQIRDVLELLRRNGTTSGAIPTKKSEALQW
jgi:TP901 family phage tail tape measure protein